MLVSRGHEVRVVVPGEGSLSDELRADGIEVDIIPFRGFSILGIIRSVRAVFDIRRIANGYRPDIVHAHLLKAAVVSRIATMWLRRIKMVSQIPGVVHLEMPLLKLIERLTIRADDLTLVSSSRFRTTFERLGARRVRVNHYGMDTQAFVESFAKRRSLAPSAEGTLAPQVVMIAHMYPTEALSFRYVGVKGHEVYIDSMNYVLERRPDATFSIVGDVFAGSDGYRRRLEGRAKSVSSNVNFVGRSTDIPGILSTATIAVNPSLSESASYTVMEACLAGLPVVVTDVGGLTDTVVDAVTGIVVQPNDARALGEAILTLLQEPIRSTEMGMLGREHVSSTFSLDNTVSGLEGHYFDILNGGARL